MRINESARRHGVSDADMLHATRTVRRVIAEQSDGRILFIGMSRSGQELEVVVKIHDDGEPEIIHAMRLRRNYYRYLRRGDEDDER